MGVCVNFLKKSFSQSVSEPEFLLSTYNISIDQSKDDYHSETAGDYVLFIISFVYSKKNVKDSKNKQYFTIFMKFNSAGPVGKNGPKF